MPVSWSFADRMIRLGGVKVGGIPQADAVRQTETAKEIISLFSTQPGIVLADEVGMGKTYVAMAVIASVLMHTKGRPPVVVMTPPGLASKWRAEWQQFKATCILDPKVMAPFRDVFAGNPTEFFRAMGDRAGRAHLIWMSTRCFARGLQDPWIKLALCRIARSRTKMTSESRKRFYKWADVLVRMQSRRQVTPDLIQRLMNTPIDRWHDRLVVEGLIDENDPGLVPRHLIRHADDFDCTSLIAVLRDGTIPGRQGIVSSDRLRDARRDFNDACQLAYEDWVRLADWNASLLVLDEAHHAKNDATWLARMFRARDFEEIEALILGRGNGSTRPIFWGKFDRMLFLTATPFQLGHDELIRVLRSFAAAKWSGSTAPCHDRQRLLADLAELEIRLNDNRKCGRRLDDLWYKLDRDRVARAAPAMKDLGAAAECWWAKVEAGEGDPFDHEIQEAVQRFIATKSRAQDDTDRPWASLRAWVIRHNRPMTLPPLNGETLPRRISRHGRAILDAEENDLEGGIGLDLGEEDPLPFLLAARAQGELAGSPGRGRVFFAEGLASSYEAFHHTREERGSDVRDTVDQQDSPGDVAVPESTVPVAWYEQQVEAFVPDRSRADEASRHPKLHAVVQRTVELWGSGEKVLIFCTYRETAKALREHIREAVDTRILRLVAQKTGLDETATAKARQILDRVTRRLSDTGGPLHREVTRFLDGILNQQEFQGLQEQRGGLVKLMVSYIRSPSFLARYLPARFFGTQAADDADALSEAIDRTTDLSGTTLRDRMVEFLLFATELAARGHVIAALSDDEEPPDPLGEYLDAVAVSIRPKAVAQDEGISDGRGMSFRALHMVRMVFGDTPRDVRERVMLAFNSPLFPEVLISSAVLGEGVDLHRFCRFVIHHDLSWNPSVIEQRTGRLDRIRCRAETARRPIVVYQPYIAESADEKLYRVLRDRERWFQVVMGQRFSFDERTSERITDRVPLPRGLADKLIFDLRRHDPEASTKREVLTCSGLPVEMDPEGDTKSSSICQHGFTQSPTSAE